MVCLYRVELEPSSTRAVGIFFPPGGDRRALELARPLEVWESLLRDGDRGGVVPAGRSPANPRVPRLDVNRSNFRGLFHNKVVWLAIPFARFAGAGVHSEAALTSGGVRRSLSGLASLQLVGRGGKNLSFVVE